MLDGESNLIREAALKDMRKTKLHVNIYAHDCSCKVKKAFEGKYCNRCLLDGYHASTHKCKLQSVKYRANMISQASI